MTITVGTGGVSGGGGITVNPSTRRVFVTNSAADSVSMFDGATGALGTTIGVGDDPMPIAIDTVLNRIYVGNRGSATVLTLGDGP
jgi:YVTN family beta-propeller protein